MLGNLFNTKRKPSGDSEPAATTTKEVKTEETVGGGGFGIGVAAVGSDILGNPVSVVAPVVAPVISSHSSTKVTEKTTENGAPSSAKGEPTKGEDDKKSDQTASTKEDMAALSRLDPRSIKVLNQAQTLAKSNKQSLVEPIHVLYGLLYDNEVAKTLESFSVDVAKLSKEIEDAQKKGDFTGQPTLSEASRGIFDEAYDTAKSRGSSFISPEDILLATFNATTTADFMKEKGIERGNVENTLTKSGTYTVAKRSMIEKYSIDLTLEAREGRLDPVTGRDREIDRLIHILLRRTKNNPIIIGEAGVGKTAIVEGLAQRIVAGTVPKELLERKIMQLDLASLIAGASHRGEFEERFRAVIKEAQASMGQLVLFIDEIHSLIGAGDDGGAMDASNIIKPYLARGQIQLIGTTTTSEFRKYFEKDKAFERRFQPVQVDEPDIDTAIEMLKVIQPKYEAFHKVKFLPEAIEASVKLSKKYVGERFLPDKAVDLLDEAAAEVKLRANSAALPKEEEAKPESQEVAAQHEEGQVRAQQTQELKTEGQNGEVKETEGETDQSQEAAQGSKEPDSQASEDGQGKDQAEGQNPQEADAKPQVSEIADGDSVVKKSDIEKVVSSWTGIPITKLTEDESQKLLKLEELIHKRFIDQEEAVVTIAESIRRGRIGLAAANRPIASFIFLGPTGVGKTELAKTIAEILFGKEEAMVRLDMSEYMEKHEVAKLIGAPPGYVGYEEGGQLTEAVRTKPYSIVLLDEVEKAHPDVFNILLQLLEDGRLTDNKGNTISFKNTVIVATSNLGSAIIQKELAEGGANLSQEDFNKKFSDLSKTLMDELHKFFRPELLNRFDGLVVFKPLSPKDMNQIAKLSIEKTRKLLKEQGYDLQITQPALDKLAEEGYDPVYGARPLRRLIQMNIENPISVKIIGKEFVAGDVILIDFDAQKNEYVFLKSQPTAQSTQDTNDQGSGSQPPPGPQDGEPPAPEGTPPEEGQEQQVGQQEARAEQPAGEVPQGPQVQQPQEVAQETSGQVQEQPQVINEEPVYGDNNNGLVPREDQNHTNGQAAPEQSSNGLSGTQMQRVD